MEGVNFNLMRQAADLAKDAVDGNGHVWEYQLRYYCEDENKRNSLETAQGIVYAKTIIEASLLLYCHYGDYEDLKIDLASLDSPIYEFTTKEEANNWLDNRHFDLEKPIVWKE